MEIDARGSEKSLSFCYLKIDNIFCVSRLTREGSGSTLIACEQLGRICHTIELDEKYCDVIVKRYIEQVGSADTVSVFRDGKTIRFEDLEVSADGE